MKTLIVDDSGTVRMIISKLLSDLRVTNIEEAANGKVALEAAVATRFDFILLDIHMPQMSGLEFLQALHNKEDAASHGCPVIMISSDTSYHRIEAAKKLGACGFIKKPFSIETLRRAVDIAHKRGYRTGPMTSSAAVQPLPGDGSDTPPELEPASMTGMPWRRFAEEPQTHACDLRGRRWF